MHFRYKNTILSLFISYLLPLFSLFSSPSNPFQHSSHRQKQSNSNTCIFSSASLKKEATWSVASIDTSRIQTSRKLIALTFDDAPASTLDEILKVFLEFNISHSDAPATATVFCNGKNVKNSTKHSLQTAFALGFELGNHTQNHLNLVTLPPEKITEEIQKTDELLQSIDGQKTHLLRAPYGNVNEAVRTAANAPIIDWFIDTLDWTGISKDQIYHCIWQQKFPGAIVLMHDGYANTVEALKQLLNDLYNAGYQAVTISQMAKIHGCTLLAGGVYTRIRKQTPH